MSEKPNKTDERKTVTMSDLEQDDNLSLSKPMIGGLLVGLLACGVVTNLTSSVFIGLIIGLVVYVSATRWFDETKTGE